MNDSMQSASMANYNSNFRGNYGLGDQQHGGMANSGSDYPQNSQYSQYGQSNIRPGYTPGARGVPLPTRPPMSSANMNMMGQNYTPNQQRFPMSGPSIQQQGGPTPTLNQLLQNPNAAHRYQAGYGYDGMSPQKGPSDMGNPQNFSRPQGWGSQTPNNPYQMQGNQVQGYRPQGGGQMYGRPGMGAMAGQTGSGYPSQQSTYPGQYPSTNSGSGQRFPSPHHQNSTSPYSQPPSSTPPPPSQVIKQSSSSTEQQQAPHSNHQQPPGGDSGGPGGGGGADSTSSGCAPSSALSSSSSHHPGGPHVVMENGGASNSSTDSSSKINSTSSNSSSLHNSNSAVPGDPVQAAAAAASAQQHNSVSNSQDHSSGGSGPPPPPQHHQHQHHPHHQHHHQQQHHQQHQSGGPVVSANGEDSTNSTTSILSSTGSGGDSNNSNQSRPTPSATPTSLSNSSNSSTSNSSQAATGPPHGGPAPAAAGGGPPPPAAPAPGSGGHLRPTPPSPGGQSSQGGTTGGGSRSNTPASVSGQQAGSPMPPRPPSNQIDPGAPVTPQQQQAASSRIQSPMQANQQGFNQMMPPPQGGPMSGGGPPTGGMGPPPSGAGVQGSAQGGYPGGPTPPHGGPAGKMGMVGGPNMPSYNSQYPNGPAYNNQRMGPGGHMGPGAGYGQQGGAGYGNQMQYPPHNSMDPQARGGGPGGMGPNSYPSQYGQQPGMAGNQYGGYNNMPPQHSANSGPPGMMNSSMGVRGPQPQDGGSAPMGNSTSSPAGGNQQLNNLQHGGPKGPMPPQQAVSAGAGPTPSVSPSPSGSGSVGSPGPKSGAAAAAMQVMQAAAVQSKNSPQQAQQPIPTPPPPPTPPVAASPAHPVPPSSQQTTPSHHPQQQHQGYRSHPGMPHSGPAQQRPPFQQPQPAGSGPGQHPSPHPSSHPSHGGYSQSQYGHQGMGQHHQQQPHHINTSQNQMQQQHQANSGTNAMDSSSMGMNGPVSGGSSSSSSHYNSSSSQQHHQQQSHPHHHHNAPNNEISNSLGMSGGQMSVAPSASQHGPAPISHMNNVTPGSGAPTPSSGGHMPGQQHSVKQEVGVKQEDLSTSMFNDMDSRQQSQGDMKPPSFATSSNAGDSGAATSVTQSVTSPISQATSAHGPPSLGGPQQQGGPMARTDSISATSMQPTPHHGSSHMPMPGSENNHKAGLPNNTSEGDQDSNCSSDKSSSFKVKQEIKQEIKQENMSHPNTPVAPSPSLSSVPEDLDSNSSWPGTPSTTSNQGPSSGNNQSSSSQAPTSSSDTKSNAKFGNQEVYARLCEMGEEPDRKLWLEKLFMFMEDKSSPITVVPAISKTAIDLYRLYFFTKERGGLIEVTKQKKWREISGLLNIGSSSSAGFTLKKNYCKYIFPFECAFDNGNCDPGPILAQIEAAQKKDSRKGQSPGGMMRPPDGMGHPGGPMMPPNMSVMPGQGMYPPGAGNDPMNPQAGMMGGSNGGAMMSMQEQYGGDGMKQQYPGSGGGSGSYGNQGGAAGGSGGGYPPGHAGGYNRGNPNMGPYPQGPQGSQGPPGQYGSGQPSGEQAGYNNYSGPNSQYPNRMGPPNQYGSYGDRNYDQSAVRPGMPPSSQGSGGGSDYPNRFGPGGQVANRPNMPQDQMHSQSQGPQGYPDRGGFQGNYPNQYQGQKGMYPSHPGQGTPTKPGYPGSPYQGRENYQGMPNMRRDPSQWGGMPPRFGPPSSMQGSTPGGGHYQGGMTQTGSMPASSGAGPLPGAGPPGSYMGPYKQGQGGPPGSMGPGAMSPQRPGDKAQGPVGPGGYMPSPSPKLQSLQGSQKPSNQFPAKKEIIFPPDSVEATQVHLPKRKRITHRDIDKVEPWRFMMCLKSGLLTESTWAIDTLNILLFDDHTVQYFGLAHMPGLLEILTEQLRRCLIKIFPDEFESLEPKGRLLVKQQAVAPVAVASREGGDGDNPRVGCMLAEEEGGVVDETHLEPPPCKRIKSEEGTDEEEKEADSEEQEPEQKPEQVGGGDSEESESDDSDEESDFNYSRFNLPVSTPKKSHLKKLGNYTLKSRKGKPVLFKDCSDKNEVMFEEMTWDKYDGFVSGTADWAAGGGDMTEHIMTHIESCSSVEFYRGIYLKRQKGHDKSAQSADVEDSNNNADTVSEHTCSSKDSSPEPMDIKVEAGAKVKEEVINEDTDSGVKTEPDSPSTTVDVKKEDILNDSTQSDVNDVITSIECNELDKKFLERLKRKLDNGREEAEAYKKDTPALNLTEEGEDEIGRRSVAISNILRNLSFIPGNDREMSKHQGLMCLAGRLLLLRHAHPRRSKNKRKFDSESLASSVSANPTDPSLDEVIGDGRDEWWWDHLDGLRENILVMFGNIAGHLNLSVFSEEICLPMLNGLLHWAVCPSSCAHDPMPTMSSHSVLSPHRLVLEALCKLCVTDTNVDLLLATPPFSRIVQLFVLLVRHLSDRSDQVMQEFAVVLLSSLVAADTSASRALALQHPAISLLLDFIETAESSAVQIVNAHGLAQGHTMLRQNPAEMMGTSLDMLRRTANTLKHLALVPENRSLFVHQQDRMLALVMSQVLDANVATVMADVMFFSSQPPGSDSDMNSLTS